MKKAKQILAIVIAVLGLVVVLQNTDPVETELLWVKSTMPLAVLLLLAIGIGIILGILLIKIFRKR